MISTNLIARIIKYGIYLCFFSFLIISATTYFPFIVGKYVFFRILVEVLTFLYIILIILDKSYRPKLSKIFIFLSLFVFFALLSTVFGADPYRSFWSNYERMEGFLTLIHYFAFFVIISGVFKEEKDFERGAKAFFIAGALMVRKVLFMLPNQYSL